MIVGLLLGLSCYALACEWLRRRRLAGIHAQFPYDHANFGTMTDDDATQIQLLMSQLEFPFTFEKGLQFALFKTYGIPSISRLLLETGDISHPSTASKRYVDTEVLMAEILAHPPVAKRSQTAIARVNYIHSHYRKIGKISNDDMLYTLSLFALEPIRWIDRYEWRRVLPFELCAMGTFWKSLGDSMDISYESLGDGKASWENGLEWLKDIQEWSEAYEETCMVPARTNHDTALQTIEILLWPVPLILKPLGRQVVSALLEQRLRKAMMLPDAPAGLKQAIAVAFSCRRWLLRNLIPPRPHWMRVHHINEKPNSQGLYNMPDYVAKPYYVRPTLWNRFGPRAMISRIRGLPLPGDQPSFQSQGYNIERVGPAGLTNSGKQYMTEALSDLAVKRTGGSPFARY